MAQVIKQTTFYYKRKETLLAAYIVAMVYLLAVNICDEHLELFAKILSFRSIMAIVSSLAMVTSNS